MQLLKQGDHKEVAMAQDDVHEEIEKTTETHQDKVVTDSNEGVGSAGGSLFVSNLSRNVTSGHLREIFGYYGNVKNVDLKYDRKNRQSKGQATISFQTEKDAEHAMFYLDGGQIDGSEIKVSFVLVEQDHNRGSSSPAAQKSDHRENEGKDRRRPEDSERNQTTSAQGREADRRPPADSMRDERERGGQGQGRPRNTNQPTSNQPPANHRRDEPTEGGFRRRSRSPPQRGRERDFRDRDSRYGPPASRPANDNYPNRRGGDNAGPVRRSRSRDRRGDPPLNNNRRNPPPPINRGRSRSRSGGRRPVNPRDQRFNGNRNAPINRDRERERDRSRDRDNRRHRSPSRSISRSRSRSPAYRRRRGSRSSSSRSRSKSPASSNSSDSRYRKRRRSPSSSRSRSRSHSSRSRSRSSKSSRSSYRSRRSRSRDSNRSRRSASSHRSEGRDDKRGDGDEGEPTKKED